MREFIGFEPPKGFCLDAILLLSRRQTNIAELRLLRLHH